MVINDLTLEEKNLSLRIQMRNKDKALSTVTHELRNPLTGIIGILDSIQKDVNSVIRSKLVEICKANANYLLTMVNSILDLQQARI